jgi:hypothetical protein
MMRKKNNNSVCSTEKEEMLLPAGRPSFHCRKAKEMVQGRQGQADNGRPAGSEREKKHTMKTARSG